MLSTQFFSPRTKNAHWEYAVGNTYFPLCISPLDETSFNGELCAYEVPEWGGSLSFLGSSAARYSRSRQHVSRDTQAYYLVTAPLRAPVRFEQGGRKHVCRPGMFLIEKSEEPYRLEYESDNEMFVLKIPEAEICGRVYGMDRYARHCFDATAGVGKVFVEQMRTLFQQFGYCSGEHRRVLMDQAVTMLALVLHGDQRVLNSEESHLRAFHLNRIEAYMDRHLDDPELSPARIAEACNLSVRYLYKLFRDQQVSPSELVKQKRLNMVYAALKNSGCRASIGELAFRWGFNDQSQFAHAFKKQFGCSASDVRQRHQPTEFRALAGC